MWIRSRQYTGRVVTISNAKIFDEPVYNYTRDFPYIWEEIVIPITYKEKRKRVEEIMLQVAHAHTESISNLSTEALAQMQKLFFLRSADMVPRVYYRMTDNWLELSLRFIAKDHGVRELKDRIYRDLVEAFESESIGIASATYDIVGFPPLTIAQTVAPAPSKT
jgi:small-conductance mechanosensitive channel